MVPESREDLPLKGVRVLELAGLAPAPFLGLLLSTYGASVLRIDRPSSLAPFTPAVDTLTAHKSGSIPLDLKQPTSLSILHSLLQTTDVLIDPYRPSVLPSLLNIPSAATLLQRYPRLIIVRLTGFRRDGKWRARAGHDINYLAVSGVLSLLGEKDRPPKPPGNLLADFAGGGLSAFAGVLMALVKRGGGGEAGKGSVVDANMVDGSAFLAMFARLGRKTGVWDGPRGTNLLDGACPFYQCYECKDSGRYVAVGALEPQFFSQLLSGLELDESDILAGAEGRQEDGGESVGNRFDKEGWEFMRSVFAKKFREKTRDEWEKVFEGRDACVTPMRTMDELEEDEEWENRVPVHVRGESEQENQKDDHPSDGIGWSSEGMDIGYQAEQVLRDWLGWEKEKDWTVDSNGAYVSVSRDGRSKL